LILILVTVVRLRLAPSPLERDEGEYAFIGQLMLQGIPPYKEAANIKFPGTYAAYAAIETVFGQTPEGIHRGLLVVNLATILLVCHLGRRFLGSRHTAVMAAAVYAVSSLSFSFLGPMAHATHFVVLFGLAGVALLLAAVRRNSIVGFACAGFITGLAYMAKQSGFYFVPFGCLLLVSEHGWRTLSAPAMRALSYFLAGAFAPFAFTVLLFQRLGCLDDFLFWTFRYASTYSLSLGALPEVFSLQGPKIYHLGLGWIFFCPCALLFLPPIWRRARPPRRTMLVLTLFLALSLAGVSLGLYFRGHYWIQALPAVALLSALFFETVPTAICHRLAPASAAAVASLLCLSLCGAVLAREAPRFFFTPPTQIIWDTYPGCPFVESVAIADYIQRHSEPQDRIFVFGAEPQLYFYAGRRAAASNLYLYNLLGNQPYVALMQRHMAAEVERNHPRFFIEAHQTYFPPPDMQRLIPLFRWKASYLAEHYRPVFMLDHQPSGSRLIQGDSLLSYRSPYDCFVIVWEWESP